jgi:hypothetical protein
MTVLSKRPTRPATAAYDAHGRSALRRSSSCCPRRMEHHSLCSATGMPHSTQTRTRWVFAGVFDEKSRLRNDIQVSGSNNHAPSLRNEPRPGYTRPGRTRHVPIPWLDRGIRRRVGMARCRSAARPLGLGCLAAVWRSARVTNCPPRDRWPKLPILPAVLHSARNRRAQLGTKRR